MAAWIKACVSKCPLQLGETHYVTGGRNCPERKEVDKTVPAFLPLSYSMEIRCDGRAWAATLWHEVEMAVY